jgi:PPM family protein phosphatase
MSSSNQRLFRLDRIKNILKKITQTNDKNLSTVPSSSAIWEESYLKRVIDNRHIDKNTRCPFTGDHLDIKVPMANVSSTTTWGGPGSKYREINEDSFFSGMSRHGNFIAGVIDGAGGSNHGFLGGKCANFALSDALMHDYSLRQAFALADKDVSVNAYGGYATGVSTVIDSGYKVLLGSKGDSRALTIRDGEIMIPGTTKLHSKVAYEIEEGTLPAKAIHTSKSKHIVCSVIGNIKKPLFETWFQGKPGDQMILASDGLWDVVSDYEILKFAQNLRGQRLQKAIYQLAYERNNSTESFQIEFAMNDFISMQPFYVKGRKTSGDNITVLVIDIANNHAEFKKKAAKQLPF